MKPVTGEFEIIDDKRSWLAEHPGFAWTVGAAVLAAIQFIAGSWMDMRQKPQFEQINKVMAKHSQDHRSLATFQLEQARYIGATLSRIADSANVSMPSRPKELDRAEERVRDIQERVN
jgi:hypothetical protein